MALNRSPEFKGVIVQIVCVVEIPFESAWAVTNLPREPFAMLDSAFVAWLDF